MKSFLILNIILLYLTFIHCYNTDADLINCKYDDIDQDYYYDSNTTVNINCKENECNIIGEGAEFTDKILTINKLGTYVVGGSLNGKVIVEVNEEDIVRLIFDNLKINSDNEPALFIASASKVSLTLEGENILQSSFENDGENSVILSNSNLSINGIGSLKIENKLGDLIDCNQDLKLVSGEIIINSISDMNKIQAKDSFCVKDAIFNILSNNINSTETISKTSTKTISASTKTTTTNIPKTIPTYTKSIPITQGSKTIPSGSKPTLSNCPGIIQAMGYRCCKSGCDIIYVDQYGNWGEEDDVWCGCGGGYKCSPKILKYGYDCCPKSNCKIRYTDDDGKWGIDLNKGKWCGIRFSC